MPAVPHQPPPDHQAVAALAPFAPLAPLAPLALLALLAVAACAEEEAAPPRPIGASPAASDAPRPMRRALPRRRLEDRAAEPGAAPPPAAASGHAAPPGAAPRRGAPAAHREQLALCASPLARDLLVPGLEPAVEAAVPAIDLVVADSTERDAVADVERGRAAAALVSSEPHPSELGSTLGSRVLGYHIAALVVSDASPVRTLTDAQLRLALSGRAPDWHAIAYHRGPIELLLAPDGPALQRLLALLLPGGRLAPSARQAADERTLLAEVAADPRRLGILRLGAGYDGAGVRILGVHGVAPSYRTAASGTYPFACAVRLVHRLEAPAGVRLLLAFLDSPAGRSLLRARLTTR
jgi:hypothetical protein